MNTKRMWYASIAVFVVIFIIEFIVNAVLLDGIYKQTASVWRPEADIQKMMWLFWVGYLIFAPVFVRIYITGHEIGKNNIGQGLRYGTYMGLLIVIPMNLGWYAVLPIPAALSVYWMIAGMVEMIVAGITVSLIYRN
ncbi:MAG: hypothetical protein HY082_06030 [Gammaproteobacteria bacterium]|nr:hypothetical protein [Gammaproteobacteria bacterium]